MASSDSFIRNKYREVTGRSADDSVLRAARSIPDQDLASFFQSGGVEAYANSPEAAIESARQAVLEAFKPFEEAAKRSGEFDEKNPFIFDEALARASSEERFDPFYQAELRDFLTGINRQRGRTVQDEERLRKELTTETENYVGRAKREIDQALEGSKEGFAGAGLFFGGQRLRREGQIGIEGEEKIGDFTRGQGIRQEESQLRQARTLEDIGSRESTTRRQLGAARETDILTDIAGQRREQQQQRELERQQFVGYPLATGTSGLQSILGL